MVSVHAWSPEVIQDFPKSKRIGNEHVPIILDLLPVSTPHY